MKAVIFAGGSIDSYKKVKKYLEGSSLIICADSGVEHAFNMGIEPDLLVGDMDSISSVSLEKANKLGIERQQFPSEKDCTDTELALDIALKKGADEAIILGALGDRPDHSLANIFLMVGFKKLGLEVKLADRNWDVFNRRSCGNSREKGRYSFADPHKFRSLRGRDLEPVLSLER